MSILVDRDIRVGMADGSIVIEPFRDHALGTNSYDVHLGATLLTYALPTEWHPLDCKVEPTTYEQVIPHEGLVLMPGELYLAVTEEYTETHDTVPFLEGKSSLGRLGLSIHVTAGKGDVHFCGHWTMEITVVHPLRVYAGMPIGQLIYHSISNSPLVPYSAKPSAKYGGLSTKPVASKMWRNFPDTSQEG